jgi:hypothetical protein
MVCEILYYNLEGKRKGKIAEYVSVQNTFVIVPSYTVGLLIITIISLFGAKYIPVFVYRICHTYLLSSTFAC